MNSRSITDYILKLEKENSELRKVRAVLGDIDSIEESRTKIEQLKKLLTEANEEKVDALNKLNDLEYKSSLYRHDLSCYIQELHSQSRSCQSYD